MQFVFTMFAACILSSIAMAQQNPPIPSHIKCTVNYYNMADSSKNQVVEMNAWAFNPLAGTWYLQLQRFEDFDIVMIPQPADPKQVVVDPVLINIVDHQSGASSLSQVAWMKHKTAQPSMLIMSTFSRYATDPYKSEQVQLQCVQP